MKSRASTRKRASDSAKGAKDVESVRLSRVYESVAYSNCDSNYNNTLIRVSHVRKSKPKKRAKKDKKMRKKKDKIKEHRKSIVSASTRR